MDRARERLSIAARALASLRELALLPEPHLTAHTYNEALAERIFSRLPSHLALMEHWLSEMSRRASP